MGSQNNPQDHVPCPKKRPCAFIKRPPRSFGDHNHHVFISPFWRNTFRSLSLPAARSCLALFPKFLLLQVTKVGLMRIALERRTNRTRTASVCRRELMAEINGVAARLQAPALSQNITEMRPGRSVRSRFDPCKYLAVGQHNWNHFGGRCTTHVRAGIG